MLQREMNDIWLNIYIFAVVIIIVTMNKRHLTRAWLEYNLSKSIENYFLILFADGRISVWR